MSKNPWFDDIMPSREELEAFRQETYESAVVKRLMLRLGAGGRMQELRKLADDALTFNAFSQCVQFPLTLGTKKMPNITAETLMEMQTRPKKTPIFQAFYTLSEEQPDAYEAGILGLVFSWPGWSKFMLLHTMDTTHHQKGSRMIWYPGREHRPHILEPLDSCLDALGLIKSKDATE